MTHEPFENARSGWSAGVGRARLTVLCAQLLLACAGQSQDELHAAAPFARAPDQKNKGRRVVPPPTGAPPGRTEPAASVLPALSTAPEPLEDLLWVTDAWVNLSSSANNGRSYPEQLVDGDLGTAWQSRADDPKPSLRVTLPRDIQVERLELSAGYTLSSGRQDAFTQNPRITEVLVRRDAVEIGRFALDPQLRTPQPIALSGPGGEFEILVTRTLPGSRAEWREVASSELHVLGYAGKSRLSTPRPPAVEVNFATAAEVEAKTAGAISELPPSAAVFPSVDAWCADFLAHSPTTLPDANGTAQKPRGKAQCLKVPGSYALPENNVFLTLQAVRSFDGFTHDVRLLLRVPFGFVALPLGLAVRPTLAPLDPTRFAPDRVSAIRIDNGHLVLVLRAQDKKDQRLGVLWCAAVAGAVACQQFDPSTVNSAASFRIAADGTFHPEAPLGSR